jgi:hypothetical protein
MTPRYAGTTMPFNGLELALPETVEPEDRASSLAFEPLPALARLERVHDAGAGHGARDYRPGPRGFPPSPNGLRLSGARMRVRCSRGLGGNRLGLATVGPVEHSPHGEIAAQLTKLMLDTGGHEQQVASLKGFPFAIVKQNTAASNDNVKLVLLVRRLRYGRRGHR